MLKDDVVADDVVQDVFCALWDKRTQLDFSISIKSYLYRAVHNRSLNAINERRNNVTLDNLLSEDELNICSIIAHADDLEARDLEKAISEVLDSLPERCREVFQLSRGKGLKNREIAETLNISVKAVEKQITKALMKIREFLKTLVLMAFSMILTFFAQ
jgi:RNA polymerase sigma-70 factor (ECF subfamily)